MLRISANVWCSNLGCCLALAPLLQAPPMTRWFASFCHARDIKSYHIRGRTCAHKRHYDGIFEGSPGVVPNTMWRLQRCAHKGHVDVLPGRFGVLCHNPSFQTRAHVSNHIIKTPAQLWLKFRSKDSSRFLIISREVQVTDGSWRP